MEWSEGFVLVARDREVTGEMFRVLFVILGRVEAGYSADITQAELAVVLGMRPC